MILSIFFSEQNYKPKPKLKPESKKTDSNATDEEITGEDAKKEDSQESSDSKKPEDQGRVLFDLCFCTFCTALKVEILIFQFKFFLS